MSNSKIIACIVEGAAEKFIITKLLDENKLKFSREKLLEEEVISVRSAKKFEEKYLSKNFESKITVYRILDSKKEKFKLSKVYENKVDVINIVTAPEIEILIIINENRYKDYCKYKSSLKPSEYCKQNLKYRNVKKMDFLKEYFCDVLKLENAIKKYKKIHKGKKGELCVADLLKE